jgi:PhnB protein
MRMADPKGKIRHAEIRIGDSPIMIGDEFQEFPEMRSFQALGGSPVSVYLYVEDVDAMFNRAVAAGAKVRSPIKDEFYGDGDRVGAVEDPYGLAWFIATHKEEVAPEEIVRRASAMRD